MKYPPNLLDDIRARLAVSQVVGRKVALKKSGREWRGMSPFKSEKSPSFFVNDQKGFYHCFASGEHGDIFTFLMKTEGLTFPEAIERLAEEAGVPLPKPEARNPEREDERKRLYDLLEASAKFFEASYKAPEAEHARRYVREKRGLSGGTVERFRMGYAPDNKNALKQHLAKLGFANDDMIASGMLIGGADIPVSYDRFRNRVMFPIADLKGKIIAFGGRALDPDAPAKYLNSPETPLFHKGHILFHAAGARGPAHEKGRVIAVEGYMDVVALTAAGFPESVAPLGTALTEDQAKLLWRMAVEPILCFDGDAAGKKAAFRAVDTVLPHLVPGKSVRFAFLPDGLDPDEIIRRDGPEAMEAALGATRSLSDVLFDREWASGDWTTPERRAKLEQQVFALVQRIENEQVRGYYREDMQARLAKAFGRPVSGHAAPTYRDTSPDHGMPPEDAPRERRPWQPKGGGGSFSGGRGGAAHAGKARGGRGWPPPGLLDIPQAASLSLKQNLQSGADLAPRETQILRAMVNHPWTIEEQWEELSRLEFTTSVAKRLRAVLLDMPAHNIPLDTQSIRTHLHNLGFEKALRHLDQRSTHRGDRFAEADADRDTVAEGLKHAVRVQARDGLRHALAEAEAEWMENPSEDVWARITELKRQQAQPVDFEEGSSQ